MAEGVSFPPSLRHAVDRRRAEYLAGRMLAKRNLARLHYPDNGLLPDRDGVPQWPAGIAGSLSHTCGRVVCATLPVGQAARVGIDAETLISAEDACHLCPHILCPQEYAFARAQPLAFHQMLTLIFSAKESSYKLVFPYARNTLSFHSVRLIAFDPHRGTFSLTIPDDLAALFYPRRKAEGTFVQLGDDIITLLKLGCPSS